MQHEMAMLLMMKVLVLVLVALTALHSKQATLMLQLLQKRRQLSLLS